MRQPGSAIQPPTILSSRRRQVSRTGSGMVVTIGGGFIILAVFLVDHDRTASPSSDEDTALCGTIIIPCLGNEPVRQPTIPFRNDVAR